MENPMENPKKVANSKRKSLRSHSCGQWAILSLLPGPAVIIHGIFMDFPVQKPSSFAHGHGKPHLRPLRIRSTPERRVLDQVLQGWSGAARTQPVAHKGQENPWGKCQEIRDFCIVTKCRSVVRCWEYEKIPIWYGSACIYDYKLSSPPKIWEGPEFGFYLGHHESISM